MALSFVKSKDLPSPAIEVQHSELAFSNLTDVRFEFNKSATSVKRIVSSMRQLERRLNDTQSITSAANAQIQAGVQALDQAISDINMSTIDQLRVVMDNQSMLEIDLSSLEQAADLDRVEVNASLTALRNTLTLSQATTASSLLDLQGAVLNNSIELLDMKRRTAVLEDTVRDFDGSSRSAAGRTCSHIYNVLQGAMASGWFWIDPNGASSDDSIRVHCTVVGPDLSVDSLLIDVKCPAFSFAMVLIPRFQRSRTFQRKITVH
eukprot:TRINITY_DN10404_c0_g1_i2.p2 TRINITY_DN10404_c0_g1~~TRINITY_DN10404_c0_g1_i2.p2  ORF type:complete len:278 (+),score=40.09 TRINITY_DN10404_c0_g1_i2:48-836(+)